MKINVNGVTREMTQDEILEMDRMAAEMPKPEPSAEERLKTIEEELRAAKILLGLEV